MKLRLPRRPTAVAVACLIAVACGSGTSPTTVPSTTPTTTLAPAPAPTPAAQSCPLGYGSGKFTCQGDVPGLLPSLKAAIDQVVQAKPDLFDLNNPVGEHGYLVRDPSTFYSLLIGNLVNMGMCAQLDFAGETLSIKGDNTYSEDYHVLTSQSRIYVWQPKSYQKTCTPANFPLTADQAVARVVVSSYGVQCPGGDGPPAAENVVPVTCRASITATPKDAVGNDVPLTIHGGVSWFVRDGEGTVGTYWIPDPNQPFNAIVYGIQPGSFSICATVNNKTGCWNAQVVNEAH
jgi:hypothetical protein